MFESMYWPMGLSIMFLILFFMGKKKDTALLLFSFYFGSMLIDRLLSFKKQKVHGYIPFGKFFIL